MAADVRDQIDKHYRDALAIAVRAEADPTYKATHAASKWAAQIQAAANALMGLEDKIELLGVLAGRLERASETTSRRGRALQGCHAHACRVRDAVALQGLAGDAPRH